MANQFEALLTLSSSPTAVVQLKSASDNDTTVYMFRRRAIIQAVCDNSAVNDRMKECSLARSCPQYVRCVLRFQIQSDKETKCPCGQRRFAFADENVAVWM